MYRAVAFIGLITLFFQVNTAFAKQGLGLDLDELEAFKQIDHIPPRQQWRGFLLPAQSWSVQGDG